MYHGFNMYLNLIFYFSFFLFWFLGHTKDAQGLLLALTYPRLHNWLTSKSSLEKVWEQYGRECYKAKIESPLLWKTVIKPKEVSVSWAENYVRMKSRMKSG